LTVAEIETLNSEFVTPLLSEFTVRAVLIQVRKLERRPSEPLDLLADVMARPRSVASASDGCVSPSLIRVEVGREEVPVGLPA
jgi:hypothetical protein